MLTKEKVFEKIKEDRQEWEDSHDYWNGGEASENAPYGWDVNVIGSTFGTKEDEYKAIVTKCKIEDGQSIIGDEVLFEFTIDSRGLLV
ncbi:MAG: Unknown protein [uncultured Sulfurovum sp.]|uniref:Uncharacterized protein n=1 Tax=uncultured Sulfurovum sp. TaxID=269237 RepID=A0A6S6SWA7_9BACT|nr:MAG: Unknown protein [uncultured Sulfurovum sp.]